MQDEALMSRVARGDRDSLGKLYDRYKEALSAYLWRISGDSELVAEALSETFLRIWRSSRSYQAGKGSVKTWMYTIAGNTLRSLWRKEHHADIHQPMVDIGDPTQAHDDQGIASALLQGVWDGLDQDHRQALSLRYFSDLDYDEIAGIQGVPVATARTRVFYAIRKLRKLMEERR